MEIADAIAESASRFMRATASRRKSEPNAPRRIDAADEALSTVGRLETVTSSDANGPMESTIALDAQVISSLQMCIQKTIQTLDDKQRHIFVTRFGVYGTHKTLEEIGVDLNVTRERVRQIEKKMLGRLKTSFAWPGKLVDEITKQIDASNEPVWLSTISAQSDFFEGRAMPDSSLGDLIQRLSEDSIQCFRLDGLWVATYVSEKNYLRLKSRLLTSIRNIADFRPAKAEVDVLAESLCASNSCRELAAEILRGIAPYLHFATPPGEAESRLVAFGRGADQIVRAVLEMSDEPLHYLEVARRATLLKGEEVEIRRVHNALSQPGIYLLGRGSYGLRRHLDLSEDEADAICEAAEGILLSGDAHRQWHASEIIDLLPFDVIPLGKEITPHQLSFALSRSRRLRYLNRLVWASADSNYMLSADRIDIAQACLTILKDAGKPLSRSQILDQLRDWRGVSSYFQIHLSDKIIAIAPGVFGLRDRDIPVSADDVARMLDLLAAHLALTNEGVHVSEIKDLIRRGQPMLHLTDNIYWVTSVAANDIRMRTFVGGYIGLRTWDDAHRLSISRAIAMLVAESPGIYSIDSLCRTVSAVCKRPIGRTEIVGALRDAGFTHETNLDLWDVSVKSVDDGD